jgi:hypothetical protein
LRAVANPPRAWNFAALQDRCYPNEHGHHKRVGTKKTRQISNRILLLFVCLFVISVFFVVKSFAVTPNAACWPRYVAFAHVKRNMGAQSATIFRECTAPGAPFKPGT